MTKKFPHSNPGLADMLPSGYADSRGGLSFPVRTYIISTLIKILLLITLPVLVR